MPKAKNMYMYITKYVYNKNSVLLEGKRLVIMMEEVFFSSCLKTG